MRVVAKDRADDVNIFENDGMSMIRSFRIARYCPEPVQIKATAERGYIRLEWEGAPEHMSEKIMKPEDMVENVIKYFDKIEKFNVVFKVVE